MIVDGELRPFRLRLRAPLETGAGTLLAREGVLVVLRDEAGRHGYGEAAPLPGRQAFQQEDVVSCHRALARAIVQVRGRSPGDVEDLLEAIPPGRPAARFALECATVDLAARAAGARVADWLAGGRVERDRVPVNALVAGADPEAVRAAGVRQLASGFETFKLKVGVGSVGEDAKRVEALRRAVGPGAKIRLDANGAWPADEATAALEELGRFDLEYVEDPIRIRTRADVARLSRLRSEGRVPIAADECAASPTLMREILNAHAADWLVLKPPSIGGLQATRKLAAEALRAGIRSVVTSSVDSAVGLAATLHLAASLPGRLPACGLGTADWLAEDVATPPAIEKGWMPLAAAAGLGLVAGAGAGAESVGRA